MVFWSNKLDFVAEMDVISSGLRFCRRKEKKPKKKYKDEDVDEDSMGEVWKKLIYLFEDDRDVIISVDFIIYKLLKVVVAVFIIPLWLITGAVTFGLLWPPQIRAKLMTTTARLNGNASAEYERKSQMKTLRQDLSSLQDEIKAGIDLGRQELDTVRSALDVAKSDISIEMNNVKDIVTELFQYLSAS